MSWRRLRPGELDHEALWLGVSLGALAMAWLWFHLELPRPACVFHQWTGWACPGCGSTRCLRLALAGAFGEAIRINPLTSLFFAGTLAFDLYAVAVLVGRLPRWRFDPVSERTARRLRVLAFTALLLNWLWLIWSGV